MEAGMIFFAFLADAATFSSVINFLFAAGAAEPEGLSETQAGASLGDILNGGETFAGEGVWYGLSRRARLSYIGISSGASSLEDLFDEAEAAFFDILATDFFLEARGEADFLFFLSFPSWTTSFIVIL